MPTEENENATPQGQAGTILLNNEQKQQGVRLNTILKFILK